MEPITQPTHLLDHRRPPTGRAQPLTLGAASRIRLTTMRRILLLLVVCLPALTLRLADYPSIWFDEGYRTNAARTLAVTGQYGTYTTDGWMPYDVGISTGPADIVPQAVGYSLLGPGVAQARVIGALYALLAVGALFMLARLLFGELAGFLALLLVLAFPPIQGVSLLLIGRQVLGETPALALVTLGLWMWFKSWGRADLGLAVASGACIGLGLLSKTQVAFGLLPAMAIVALLRGRKCRGIFFFSLPLQGTVLIIGGWQLWTAISTSPEVRIRNAQMLGNAIRTQLLTGLWGGHLDRPALAILAVMLVATLGGAWQLLRKRRRSGTLTDADWGMATLVLLVGCSAVWFGFLSIGWPRYAMVGHVFGILLLGKLAWDAYRAAATRLAGTHASMDGRSGTIAAVVLALVAVVVTIPPILRWQDASHAQQAAEYVSAHVPKDAVVESWTWELDGLTNHWLFHHPDLSYLYLAERQEFHDQVPFALHYDTLQADPDYLISGPFSQWTRLYDPEVLRTSFRKLTTIGQYVIFERIR
jgi:4-amino-4-deoxy-L-arabinose transferase-like glycosyltransferase